LFLGAPGEYENILRCWFTLILAYHQSYVVCSTILVLLETCQYCLLGKRVFGQPWMRHSASIVVILTCFFDRLFNFIRTKDAKVFISQLA
jgi:hypothetical protein